MTVKLLKLETIRKKINNMFWLSDIIKQLDLKNTSSGIITFFNNWDTIIECFGLWIKVNDPSDQELFSTNLPHLGFEDISEKKQMKQLIEIIHKLKNAPKFQLHIFDKISPKICSLLSK
jgi:hypothetical protein